VFSLLDELASRGIGIVMVSSELEEIVDNCDRVIAIGAGRVLAEFDGENVHQAAIMTTLFQVS
jgi:ABC-type sugar transport system ATPase subunit